MSSRLFRLMLVHQKVDDALRREQKSRFPDWFAIVKLKKHKLRVKDLIARLSRVPRRAS